MSDLPRTQDGLLLLYIPMWRGSTGGHQALPSRSKRMPAALKTERGLRNAESWWLELFIPLPLPAWPLRQGEKMAGGILWRCGLPWSLYSLSHTHCSPLNACRSWPPFSWPSFSLIWGNLPICVVSGLGTEKPTLFFTAQATFSPHYGFLNHKWTVLPTPLFVVEVTVFNPTGDIKT